jgi:hypothetical protein
MNPLHKFMPIIPANQASLRPVDFSAEAVVALIVCQSGQLQ